MAKGPTKTRTGARSSGGAQKGGKVRPKSAAQSAAHAKAKRTAQASPKRASKPASKTASKGRRANAGEAAPETTELSKAALRAAFEKAMEGRGLDEAEEAFDAALNDLYGFDAQAHGESPDFHEEELPSRGDVGSLLDFYSRMLHAGGGTGEDLLNDMTEGLGMVLGSGPAFAALESMLSNVSAQGAVLMNAVQTQRQLDQIGLCCTSECVKQLMSMNVGYESE